MNEFDVRSLAKKHGIDFQTCNSGQWVSTQAVTLGELKGLIEELLNTNGAARLGGEGAASLRDGRTADGGRPSA